MMRTLLIAFALTAGVIALACDGGDGGSEAATPGPNGEATVDQPSGGCIDRSTLPQPVAPWEVGADPIFFRFGLPDDVLQSGNVCPADISLVSIRLTGGVPAEPFLLMVRNVDTDEVIDFDVVPVEVPGEEDAGQFYNAIVELPGEGRWDFTVALGPGGSATYRVPVGPGPGSGPSELP